MTVPIACNLAQSDARDQMGEWHALLAAATVAAERVSPTELSLRLRDGLPHLEALVRLAQREKACCPFFEFVIRIEPDGVWLVVSVPEEGAPVLESFAI